jgi:hypothetical protein
VIALVGDSYYLRKAKSELTALAAALYERNIGITLYLSQVKSWQALPRKCLKNKACR